MSPSKPVHHHQLKVCHSALFEPVAKCWWCWRWWWRSWHLYHFSSWESLPVSPCRGHRWTSSPQPPPPTPPETSKCLSSVINMMPNQYHHHCLVIDINFKSTHLHDKIHFDNPHKGHLILFSWGSSWTFILPEYNLKMKAMLNFTLAVNIISWYQLVYIKFRTTNWKSTSKVQAARVWGNCILQHGQNILNTRKWLPKSFFLSELQELEVWICVQPKFPIIILILLKTGFINPMMMMIIIIPMFILMIIVSWAGWQTESRPISQRQLKARQMGRPLFLPYCKLFKAGIYCNIIFHIASQKQM